ncbi:MAG: helix-turn-helix domain-containing protein [Pseudomonadota bacterium]
MNSFGQLLKEYRLSKQISQLELALRCGSTQRYLSFLEAGRSAPGRDMVARIITALELDQIKASKLFTIAGYLADDVGSFDELGVLKSAAERIMAQQEPFPAVLLNINQDVISSNSSFKKLLQFAAQFAGGDFLSLSKPLNLLRLFFHENGLFPFVVNKEKFVASVIGRVLKESRGSPQAMRIIDEVMSYPHLTDIHQAVTTTHSFESVIEERYKINNHEFGLICLITSVGVPGTAFAENLRLELFYPADSESEDVIREIVFRAS